MSFSSLGLAPALVEAARSLGYSEPTPIQQQAIPVVLQGQDLLATAQTGSGKTAAFALPLLHRLLNPNPQASRELPRGIHTLVVVPTRELATQVAEVLHSLALAQPRRLRIVTVAGGVSINPQMMALRGGADVLVATPGRLLDLVDHNAIQLATLRVLVLDEADRLLDLGFSDELGAILALLPAQRQSLFFSATFPPEVQALAQRLLHEPVHLAVQASTPLPSVITQRAILVDAPRRTQLLRHLIRDQGWKRVLVFVATKYAAELVAEKLYKAGIYATAFHGDLSQGARKQVLAEFKAEQWEVVITTDLAARGIDIVKLPVVVNYDLPRSAVDYVHRIGRTGRATEAGLAVNFVSADTLEHFHLIEKRNGLTLTLEHIPGFEPAQTAAPRSLARQPPGTGGVKGKRPSKKDKLRAALQGTTGG